MTLENSYSLPNIYEYKFDLLGSARYFLVFVLPTGFHHIKMGPRDSHETTFSKPHGHYEFDRMPFRLENAPETFQRLMDITLTELIGTELFVYVIFADTLEEYEKESLNLVRLL